VHLEPRVDWNEKILKQTKSGADSGA